MKDDLEEKASLPEFAKMAPKSIKNHSTIHTIVLYYMYMEDL
jgi:hypothetical protein